MGTLRHRSRNIKRRKAEQITKAKERVEEKLAEEKRRADMRKAVAKGADSGIIKPETTKGVIAVHTVGKIDREIYKCITGDIRTDEVIITDERIAHIEENHPGDYGRFGQYIPLMISNPDYIICDERPNTARVLKEFAEDGSSEHLRLSLRLATSADAPDYKNSILTFMHIHKREYERLVKNKKILYRRE